MVTSSAQTDYASITRRLEPSRMPLFHVVKAKSKEEAEQEALATLKKALTGNQVMSYFVLH